MVHVKWLRCLIICVAAASLLGLGCGQPAHPGAPGLARASGPAGRAEPAPAPAPPAPSDEQQELSRLHDLLTRPESSSDTRQEVAALLLAKRTPEANAVLADALGGSPKPDLPRAVLAAIAAQSDPPAELRFALYELARGEALSADLKDLLAVALASFREKDLVGEMVERLGRSDLIREKLVLISALGLTGEKAAVAPLIELLRSTEPAIQLAAARALARIALTDEPGESYREWSRWWRDHQKEPREKWLDLQLQALRAEVRALNSTLEKHEETIELLTRRLVQLQQGVLAGLLPDERRKEIVKLLDDPLADLRRLAATEARKLLAHDAVEASGLAESKEQETGIIEKLLVRAVDESPEVRAAVAAALAGVKEERAANVLLERLARESDASIRAAIIDALGERREPRAVDPLIAVLGSGSEPLVISAAAALGQIGERGSPSADAAARAGGPLCDVLSGGAPPSAALREAVVRALARMAREETLDTLTRTLDDESARVRFYAAQGLENIKVGGPRVVAALLGHIGDADKGVRTAVANALGKVGDLHVAQAIAARLVPTSDEKDGEVRAAMWRAVTAVAERQGDAAATAALADGFATFDDQASVAGTTKLYELAVAQLVPGQDSARAEALRTKLADAYLRAGQANKAAQVLSEQLKGATDEATRARIERQLGRVQLQVPPFVPGAALLAKLALESPPPARDELLKEILDRAQQLRKEEKAAEAYGVLSAAREVLGPKWAGAADAERLDELWAAAAQTLFDKALGNLQSADEEVRKRAEEHLARIAKENADLLLGRLQAALEAGDEQRSAELEKLLPQARSDISAYSAAQTRADKLKVIAQWRRGGLE